MITITTSRLTLLGASPSWLAASLQGPARFAAVTGCRVAAEWPPEHWDAGACEFATRLAEDPATADCWLAFFICRLAPVPIIIGTAGFTGAPDPTGTVEVGYSLVPAEQRQGFASEATRALLAWAYRHGARHVIAHTYPALLPSIGVLRKTGFQQDGGPNAEGILRFVHQPA